MERAKTPKARKTFMGLSLVGNLGMLAYFKYGKFVLDNFAHLLQSLGVSYTPRMGSRPSGRDLVLYVSHAVVHARRVSRRACGPSIARRLRARGELLPAARRGSDHASLAFLPQLEEEKKGNLQQWSNGLTLLVIGLFQKMVLADGILAPMVEVTYLPDGTHSFGDSWMGTLAFSGQIFFDFAGYSLCALGIARCLGFELVDNFRGPYGSIGFSDFWRRWHISLSTWLRDYLYIPLGGNRGTRRRTEINLMLTMLIGGLWHGGAWAFVVWGGLHGVYLIVERWIRGTRPTEPPTPS